MSISKKKNGLGTFDFITIGLGAIVGIGWALYVNGWIARAGGPIPAVVGYAIATAGLIPMALCYAEMSSIIKEPGGAMAYANRLLNKPIAFIGGWFYIVCWLGIILWEVLFLTEIIQLLIPSLPTGVALWSLNGVDVTTTSIIIGVLLVVIFMAINVRGVKAVSRFQNIATAGLVILGLLSAIIMFTMGDFSNLQPLYTTVDGYSHKSIFDGILTCIVLLPFFMAGMDLIPQGIADADPNADSKVVGKGVIVCTIAAGLFYMLQILACGFAIPWQSFVSYETPAAPNLFFALFPDNHGLAQTFYTIMLISVIMGLLTTLNACLYGLPRLLAAMGERGLLAQSLSKMNKNNVPINAVIFTCVCSFIGLMLGLGVIDPITAVGSISILICWIIVSICVLASRRQSPDIERPFKVPGGTALVWFSIVFCSFLAVTEFIPSLPSFIGSIGLVMFVVVSVIGVGLFCLARFGKNKSTPGAKPESGSDPNPAPEPDRAA
ncbi:MAG: APC family permease [Clostridiales Family XIII bacterium]|jgi:amino acid transporter|nr:APC family permease [Clostridiales Family XIII bacterium]